jgi:uncharacterized phiE125 gp8 family phage protein
MHSILTNPPAAEPVTLAEAKLHLRVSHDHEDGAITRLITAARRHVEAAAGVKLIRQGWSVFLDDWPADRTIRLPLAPLIAIEALRMHGEDGGVSEIDPAHYFAEPAARPPRLVLRPWRVWARPGRIAAGIEIAVTAGYGEAAAAVPAPLREAVLRLVAFWFERRGDEAEHAGLPPGFGALVRPYRELRL